jgi:hypothetical protein
LVAAASKALAPSPEDTCRSSLDLAFLMADLAFAFTPDILAFTPTPDRLAAMLSVNLDAEPRCSRSLTPLSITFAPLILGKGPSPSTGW